MLLRRTIFPDRRISYLFCYRSLQAAQLALEREQATDNLKKGLERRPERKELIERMANKA
jgi:hypothetical protein